MSLAGAGLGPSAAGHIRGSAHFRQNEKVHQKDRVGDGKGHETAATARLELQKNYLPPRGQVANYGILFWLWQ
jgi:hypothetical protein